MPLTPAPVGTPGAVVASAGNVATPTTLTPATGTGYAVGDTLLCFTACSSATPTVATPAGWTSILNVTGTNGRLALFAKVAASTSEAAPSVVWSGLTTGTSGTPCQAIVAAFTNLEDSVLASMADVVGASANGTASTATSNGGAAVTTTLDKSLVLSLTTRLDDAFTTFTAPAGFTNVTAAQGTTSGLDFAMAWAYQVKTPAGAVTAPNFGLTGASSFASTGVMVALKSQLGFSDAPTGTMTMVGSAVESYGRSAYAAAVLATPGLVSYWRLDEASGNALDQKGTNHGTTLAGGITRQAAGLVPGDLDTGIRGDGAVGTYVNVPYAASMNVGAQLTVEAWVKLETYATSRDIVSRHDINTHWFLSTTSNTGFRFYVRDANLVDTVVDTIDTVQVGVRQHLVGVYDAIGGSMRLYVNGFLVGTGNRTPNANVANSTNQALQMLSQSGQLGIQGTLDDVALYNTALTQQQVLDHYTVGMAGYEKLIQQTPGLVSYLRLGEASGPAFDTKGTISGTATGGITRQVAGLLVNDTDAAIQGSGAAGTNVNVPWSARLDVGAQLTLEFWVKPTALPAGTLFPIGRQATSASLWYIRNYGGVDGRWEFNVYDTASTRHSFSSPGLTADIAEVGKRQHVVMTYDAAGTMKGYVNGVAVGTGAPAPGGVSAKGDPSVGFRIFDARTDATTFAAVFDEVAIYNVALTAQQVLDHYNVGLGAVSNSDAPTGLFRLSGTRTESYAFARSDAPTGLFRLVGSLTESQSKPAIYIDAPTQILVLSGSVTDSYFNQNAIEWKAFRVRERAPLRVSVAAITPNGRHYRWAEDEPRAENIFNGLRWGSTMPGGHESMDCVLPRKPGVIYNDLDRLTTLQVIGAGGNVVGEFRLERTPQTSGDQMAISPSAVGWQAHLDDNKGVSMIFIDRNLGNWVGMSRSREVTFRTTGYDVKPAGTALADLTSGLPVLDLGFDFNGGWTTGAYPVVESWYDAGPGNFVGRVRGDWSVDGAAAGGWAGWVVRFLTSDDDAVSAGLDTSADFFTTSTTSGSGELVSTRRYAVVQFYNVLTNVAVGSDPPNLHYGNRWANLRVAGPHNLPLYGSGASEGVLASEVIKYSVGKWAPLLKMTSDSIQATNFIIQQLAFKDMTTLGEIVKQSTRFGLEDWAVWNDKIFYLNARNSSPLAKRWRARIGPAKLEQTGQQMDQVWESILVQYNDVDGTTRVVGPPGSGVDYTDARLKDSDSENPANQLGIIRRDKLDMGVGTRAGAIEVGRRFLEEQKALDRSGRATLVGHVEDDHGVLYPYSEVKAGDSISFVDAADMSYRRIVKADHDNASKTATVDLDAPPEGLQAVLARLGVVLAPLGL